MHTYSLRQGVGGLNKLTNQYQKKMEFTIVKQMKEMRSRPNIGNFLPDSQWGYSRKKQIEIQRQQSSMGPWELPRSLLLFGVTSMSTVEAVLYTALMLVTPKGPCSREQGLSLLTKVSKKAIIGCLNFKSNHEAVIRE